MSPDAKAAALRGGIDLGGTKIQTAIMDTQRLKIEDTISTLQRSLREMEEIAQILSSAMLRA